MTLPNPKPDFQKLLEALLLGLLAFFLIGCATKQKTVRKQQEEISTLVRKAVKESLIEIEAERLKINTEITRQSTTTDSINEKAKDFKTVVKPIDPTKPATATVNGVQYDLDNAGVEVSETESNKETTRTETETETINENTEKQTGKKTKQENSDNSISETEIDRENYEKDKNKKGGISFWWFIIIPVALLLYLLYRNRKKIIPTLKFFLP